MKRIARSAIAIAMSVSVIASTAALAKNLKVERIEGAYRIELDILNAEPFADAGMPMQGMAMVAKGGAAPVQADAASHPNHHLVVHVFDRASGKVVTDARVFIAYVPLDPHGHARGSAVSVPVVVMEMMGKGPASTHYGNNVTLAPGRYRIEVKVNGTGTSFRVKV